jgi:anaerobic selenocysteine-containing dehydrogenase
MQTVTRRDFLKTTGFVAAATLMGEGLAEAFAGGKALKGGQRIRAAKKPPPFNLGNIIEQVPSACWIGKQDCALWAWKVDGKVIKLEGHRDDPRTAGALCPKGQSQIASLYDPYRLKAPLKRTNAKGQTGTWVEISWEQALSEIAARLNEIKQSDMRRFVFQAGRKKAAQWHDGAFNAAFGTVNKYGHGALCSDAGYRASELIFDTEGCAEVDFKYCNYFIAWGFNILRGGGPHLCQIGWPQQLFDAKQRGMKVVVIDPQIRGVGHFADEWIQIKPGHDLAFWLAMAQVLVEMGYIDEEYLTKFTNAPCLVGPDGLILRDANGVEMVWDRAANQAKPQNQAQEIALLGSYNVNGVNCRTAFDLYVEHIMQYTPEWAEGKCGVPAATIRRIATEFGEAAQIGQNITIDGVTLPYRPAAIGYYHAVQQEIGTITAYAAYHVAMLVGGIDVVGSTRARQGGQTKPAGKKAKYEDLAKNPEKITDEPKGPSLDGSKFFPIGSGGISLTPLVLSNPQKYGLPYPPEQMAMWVHMTNPVMGAPSQDTVVSGYSKLGLMVVVDAFLSETADLCADYVLPAATIDKYEGPLGGFNGYETHSTLRFPVVDPMFQSKPDAEIYIDLAEKLGILPQYVNALNSALGLPAGLKLDNTQKPSLPDALDRWARSKGKDLNWFRQNGVLASQMPVTQWYARLWNPPYGGVKHSFYSEILLRLGRTVAARGVNAPYVADYNPFPTWREPTMDSSLPAYDLILISYKKIEHKQTRTAHNVLLNMLDSESPLLIHPQTAAERGISDGGMVWVESHNALTGQTRTVQARAKVILGIMPGVVAMAHHHGNFSHPVSRERDRGASPNVVFPSGEGYVDLTGNQAFQVRVRVWKA